MTSLDWPRIAAFALVLAFTLLFWGAAYLVVQAWLS